jgi:DNA-binding NtrC family response regulator
VARILLIDDDEDFCPRLMEALEAHGHAVRWVEGAEHGLELLPPDQAADFDVILLDNCMPGGMNGLECLETVRSRNVHLPVILFTGCGGADVAIDASRLGAFRYLPKPNDLGRSLRRLLALLADAEQVARLSDQAVHLAGEARPGEEVLLGGSERMCEVYSQAGIAARPEARHEPVLLLGETGTGKDLVARYLFQASDRAGRPLLKINCSAFTPDSLEDELFGCDATAGLFEQADGGAVLLDHFTALAPSGQERLLQLLQDQVVQRRGGRPRPVDVRVLASTSPRTLAAARAEGLLGDRLYFRLHVFTIHLPLLRERDDDLQLLADHFRRRFALELQRHHVRSFHEQARERLRRHDWPGNIRELQHVVRQAVLACGRAEIGPEHVCIEPAVPVCAAAAEARPLSRSRQNAWGWYQWARQQNPALAGATDAEVFAWLGPRVEERDLPDNVEAFSRYLRAARAHYGEHKNLPRAGREHGRSVCRGEEI